MSLEEIAAEVCGDMTPGLDGFSNAERSSIIREQFGYATISVASQFDWDVAMKSDDPLILVATYHLANLQRDFFVTAMECGAQVTKHVRSRIVEIERVCQRIVHMLSSDDNGEHDLKYLYQR